MNAIQKQKYRWAGTNLSKVSFAIADVDPRIRLLHKTNGGLVSARDYRIAHAGEHLAHGGRWWDLGRPFMCLSLFGCMCPYDGLFFLTIRLPMTF